MDKIFIIDAVNYLFRSYYAIGPMTNNKGLSTSALYGFIRSIKKLIADFSPKYFVAVFDGPDNKQSRREVYADYKMHRKAAPEDLYPQFELADEFCKIAGISTLCISQVEADDTMASVAKLFKEKKHKSFICTSDKDLLQMIDDDIFVLHSHKNNLIIDEKKVKEILGIKPKQMLDYLSIVGDTSDNIPGIAGFGPKTASSLLNEFGTLDSIYENIEKIKSEKKQATLLNEKETAYMSKKLASLHLDLQIPKDSGFYLLKNADNEKLISFYKEMNFQTFLKEIEPKKIIEEHEKTYTLINTKNELDLLIEKMLKEPEIAIDCETTSLHPIEAELVGVGLCPKEHIAYYIPLNGFIDKQYVLSSLKKLIENENIAFFGHNLKYDYHVFLNYDITIKNISFDTILASYLLNSQNRRHGLDAIVLEKFDKKKTPIKDLIGEGKKQISMKDVPLEKVCNYCSEDVDYTYLLKNEFEKELNDKNLNDLFYNIELPLLPILVQMERKGIFVDKDKLLEMSIDLSSQLKLIEGEIFSEAGKEFNINSPKQLSEILYVDLGLTPPRSKGFSTAAPVLEKLKGKSPIINHILKYRGLQKLLSTYVDAIPKQIKTKTSRVHTTFNQSTVATGRLSSTDPNLQNIPIKSNEGKKIREGFKPQLKNWSYISADYSQIELRLLAHFSEDPRLLEAFNNNEDIHSFTASLVYNVPIEDVTKQMRSSAKTVNFGILYGQSAFGLSELLGISPKDASIFIKTYFERYNKVAEYLTNCKKEVLSTKTAYTLFGRQRPIYEIDNKNPILRSAAERLAINTPLQGTAADLIKIAMINIDKEIKERNFKGYMILQIHDELLFEVPDAEIDVFKKFIKDKMENVFKLKVPLIVDIEVGKNLSEC